jgi:hypothetical protein
LVDEVRHGRFIESHPALQTLERVMFLAVAERMNAGRKPMKQYINRSSAVIAEAGIERQ